MHTQTWFGNLQLDVQGSAWCSVGIQLKFLTLIKWDLTKKFQNMNNIQKAFQAKDFPTVREETMNLINVLYI